MDYFHLNPFSAGRAGVQWPPKLEHMTPLHTTHRIDRRRQSFENSPAGLFLETNELHCWTTSVLFLWNALSKHLGRQVFGVLVFGYAGPETPTVYAVLHWPLASALGTSRASSIS
jgi:hypothetical protein